jgi:ADP-L-glycero-D-manno-heptose 6-epimerase
MIIVTGAAGFIGSNMVAKLNAEGYTDLVLVDDFTKKEKHRNLDGKLIATKVPRDSFFTWFKQHHKKVDFVIHLGARTDTTEFNEHIFEKLNTGYSKTLFQLCSKFIIPLIYASSAATYGMGELGYRDDHAIIKDLKPLNPYGISKNDFDKWVLEQKETPPFWAGLKFFNVYGPNEYHKGRMASVIFHAYQQIRDTGSMRLFRSHNPEFRDGEQARDFIYVKDVVDVIMHFILNETPNGIYNLGTGRARTFLDIAKATFHALELPENIEFIDTPQDIRDKYQYFTQAEMSKLHDAGYLLPFSSLEQGIDDYVKYFLVSERYI